MARSVTVIPAKKVIDNTKVENKYYKKHIQLIFGIGNKWKIQEKLINIM